MPTVTTAKKSAASLVKVSTDPGYADLSKKPKGVVGKQGGSRYFDFKAREWETGGEALNPATCAQVWKDTAEVTGYSEEL